MGFVKVWPENAAMGHAGELIEECMFCSSKDPDGYLYCRETMGSLEGEFWESALCHVCASTPAGSAAQYPNRYSYGSPQVLKAISIATNMVFERLRRIEKRLDLLQGSADKTSQSVTLRAPTKRYGDDDV